MQDAFRPLPQLQIHFRSKNQISPCICLYLFLAYEVYILNHISNNNMNNLSTFVKLFTVTVISLRYELNLAVTSLSFIKSPTYVNIGRKSPERTGHFVRAILDLYLLHHDVLSTDGNF